MTSLAMRTFQREVSRGSRPAVDQVTGYCRRAIREAAVKRWPDQRVTLVEQVPSVTGYVHRIEVGGRSVYAKTSLLGVSLVSILRGRHGSWSCVQAAQSQYLRNRGGLLQREATQLKFLSDHGHQTVDAVYEHGVLFTEPARGWPLTHIALTDPVRLHDLLVRVWRQLRRLHTSSNLGVAIEERDIAGTFIRKFSDQPDLADQLGLGYQPAAVVSGVLRVAGLLRQLPASEPHGELVYGDLKPEHVFIAQGDTVTLIDPGIMPGPLSVDFGKLTSRLLLALFCSPSHYTRDLAAVNAVDEFLRCLADAVPAAERQAWWRDLIGLWLRDTLNIAATYLAAPRGLPLPAQGREMLRRAEQLCALLENTATTLVRSTDPRQAWRRGLSEVIAR